MDELWLWLWGAMAMAMAMGGGAQYCIPNRRIPPFKTASLEKQSKRANIALFSSLKAQKGSDIMFVS